MAQWMQFAQQMMGQAQEAGMQPEKVLDVAQNTLK